MNPLWLVAGVMGLTALALATDAGHRWWEANSSAYLIFIFVLLAVSLWLRRNWLMQRLSGSADHARSLATIHCGKLLLLGLASVAAGLLWLWGTHNLDCPPLVEALPAIVFMAAGIFLIILSGLIRLSRMLKR